ncbi:MAG: sugar ABC transporter ATP-binding protein [Sphingopyxis sp.]|uniref:sugar ABC transporter ATP-binding protein n=1 Tax=Sphingopyxis sp. TaxID=1908224 RepID=UPI001A4F6902|nr:sugar ABC transporter ATP-binding protein [Sphingopyxis sp.]MBL9069173.1 sugar ABC transporter ATP-binding protein [Sphingopyxis sp.]
MGLKIGNLSKAFAAPVLRAVDIQIASGEIRGLVGENGAGKSTLLNILSGAIRADGGEILLDDEAYKPASVRAALDAGVALATQELSMIETLSAAENLALSRFPSRFGIVRRRHRDTVAKAAFASLGLSHLPPSLLASDMTLADQQLLEIARASMHGTKVLMLDEPTAALSREQAGLVHDLIRAKAAEGAAILYVSHRLEDLKQVCDTISVLRDGELILTKPSEALSIPAMIEAMAGTFAQRDRRAAARGEGPAALRVTDVTTAELPHPLSIEVKAGEVVGLAGLAGAGRSELMRAIMGLDARSGGRCERLVDGIATAVTTPADAVAAGIGYVPEDRKMSGIFAGQSVAFNLSLSALRGRRATPDSWIRERGAAIRDILKIRSSGLDQPIEQLSGGNQQKVILGRWLMLDTPVLLLDEPGRGVDVAAKADIFDEISRLAAAGAAVLMASSEMDELTSTCDRIAVMSGRRIAAIFEGPEWDEAAIMTAAFSAHVGGSAAGNEATRAGVYHD